MRVLGNNAAGEEEAGEREGAGGAEHAEADSIKNEYMALLKHVRENKERILDEEGSEGVHNLFRRTNALLANVTKAPELRLDAKVSGEVVKLSGSRIAKMCRGTGVSLEEFLKEIAGVSGKTGASRAGFDNLGDPLLTGENEGFFLYAHGFFQGAKFPDELGIAEDAVEGGGERKTQRKRRLADAGEAETPGVEGAPDEDCNILKRVKLVVELVERLGRVEFYRLVVSPSSFAETIENIFYLSFVVRLERVFLEWEGEAIYVTVQPTPGRDRAYAHFIAEMTEDRHRQIVAGLGPSVEEALLTEAWKGLADNRAQ